MRADACQVLMIYPRFDPNSFWNYRDACELVGASHPASPLGLMTVAALLPDAWTIRLIDRNTDDVTDDDIASADMVMTGGMLPQQPDALDLVARAQALGKPVVVGGPDATSSPDVYADADFRVLGEAEAILDDFVAAWRAGQRTGTFEAEKFSVDMSTSPVPRFDLIDFARYFHIAIQFSRGCPFQCEFCDIIELYGRVPRTKTPDQVIAELDRLYALGHRGYVDFVDDNLIGNKKALKLFLPRLIAWQKAHGHPFQLSTEASLNLADDDALLAMMRDAGFFVVFIGIESPDPDVLTATLKKQNTGRDIADSIDRIYAAGIFVVAGFIVGFDEEKGSVAAPVIELIEAAAIPVCMVGLLYALPNTQLTRRLMSEGRLFEGAGISKRDGDQCVTGLNFDTLRPRAQVLQDFRDIVAHVFSADAYFTRLADVVGRLDMAGRGYRLGFRHLVRDLHLFARFAWNLHRRRPDLRARFWATVMRTALTNPLALLPAGMMLAFYAHLGVFSRYVTARIDEQLNELAAERWRPPPRVAADTALPLSATGS